MAGREVYGVENNDPEMFKGANYIITPTSENTNPRESVPERTILIPLVAYTSENNAAPSIKSSIKVTSSMNK